MKNAQELNYTEIFFKYLDGEKDKFKNGKISEKKMKEEIEIYKISFLKKYYKHVISTNSESKEFMEKFLSIFPKEVMKV